MSTLYLITLIGVCTALLGVMIDAIVSVSRKSKWSQQRLSLHLVHSADRRVEQLPFVGAERRVSQFSTLTDQNEIQRKTA